MASNSEFLRLEDKDKVIMRDNTLRSCYLLTRRSKSGECK